jgi:hypothetical protein
LSDDVCLHRLPPRRERGGRPAEGRVLPDTGHAGSGQVLGAHEDQRRSPNEFGQGRECVIHEGTAVHDEGGLVLSTQP